MNNKFIIELEQEDYENVMTLVDTSLKANGLAVLKQAVAVQNILANIQKKEDYISSHAVVGRDLKEKEKEVVINEANEDS